ncbi:hypothetical protein [uncultured Sphingomonas sp.]|uniref:hypothetical protein n=1 Tax=uncultured Sphingomonas sp. TaxID=158754 RepID=UPI00261F2B76|nr:hypothetical protein [uncultured Sphingomonas sp.]
MTVFELAIFLAVYRAMSPIGSDALAETLSGWFETAITGEDVTAAAGGMVSRGWLAMTGGSLMATEEGRRVSRVLANGLIRMLDQGTRLIDVALMMAVLRLTTGELDDGRL